MFPALPSSLGVRAELQRTVVDPTDPNTLYSTDGRVVRKSVDCGKTWSASDKGLRVPRVLGLFKPRNSDWLFVSTPGGLFLSKDEGETWEDGNLWLQFDYNNRRELGGAAFIDAYWRGRYYGFIDDKAAQAEFAVGE